MVDKNIKTKDDNKINHNKNLLSLEKLVRYLISTFVSR